MNTTSSLQERDIKTKIDLCKTDNLSIGQITKNINQPDAANRTVKIKSRPNHKIYLQVLDKMGPDQRLAKAFELSAIARSLFMEGLRGSFPEKNEEEIKLIYLKRIAKCYNRNY